MIENLDNQIGDILALLDHYEIADNTLVIFASDNGAHREGGHDPRFWNSTGSLRGMKRDMHEGGIRTPMLVRWPAIIDPGHTTIISVPSGISFPQWPNSPNNQSPKTSMASPSFLF